MYTVLLIFQVLLGVGIVVLVLLQHGKGADAGAAFGSGASATVFGAQGSANFLSRTTAVLATLFFINSIALSNKYVIGTPEKAGSVVEEVAPLSSSEKPGAGANDSPADVPEASPKAGEKADRSGGDDADLPPVAPPAEGAAREEKEAPQHATGSSSGENADGKDAGAGGESSAPAQ